MFCFPLQRVSSIYAAIIKQCTKKKKKVTYTKIKNEDTSDNRKTFRQGTQTQVKMKYIIIVDKQNGTCDLIIMTLYILENSFGASKCQVFEEVTMHHSDKCFFFLHC